jgi:signal peptidase I
VFRAFVVEAFVIPTGSMATTLLGAHMRFKCPDCGYDFTTNYLSPPQRDSDDVVIPPEAKVPVQRRDPFTNAITQSLVDQTFCLICPNCGFRIPRFDRSDPDNDATSPPVHYGDRILVLKYAYLHGGPDRWDVVVFKAPFDQAKEDRPNGRVERPAWKPDFQQNYIKRLVGLPGEELMVLDGDVYTRPAATANPAGNTAAANGRSASSGWTVQPKPRHVQQALWRIISDMDYQSRNLDRAPLPPYRSPWVSLASAPSSAGAPQPMTPVTAFTPVDANRAFTFASTPERNQATLYFDPTANARRFPFTDWLVFDSTQPQQLSGRPDNYDFVEYSPDNTASDLQLRLTYQRTSGDGPLRLNLTKYDHRFVAEFLPGAVRVIHVLPGGQQETIGTAGLPGGGSPVEVEFENVDYRVTLRVNGKDLVVSTPAQYSPDVPDLLNRYYDRLRAPTPQVYIDGVGQTCKLSHLSIWRDVYYTNRGTSTFGGDPRQGKPEYPVSLGAKEFFMMGDNSALSADGRLWRYPVDLRETEDLYADSGKVPERFLLGKAFFVYWPAGHRIPGSTYGVIPNFGRMRFIH